jgi:hypothetical protein
MRFILVAPLSCYLRLFSGCGAVQRRRKAGRSPWSTGRTVLSDNRGQLQPQKWTGPLTTKASIVDPNPSSSNEVACPPNLLLPEVSEESVGNSFFREMRLYGIRTTVRLSDLRWN